MEIYNEEINDLLAPEHWRLQIHESIEVVGLPPFSSTHIKASFLP